MASQAIGSLYVALGLDSAAFTQGVKRVQGATGKLADGFGRIGDAAMKLGTRMSVISAGMGVVGGAALALVKNTADAAKEIEIQSKLANASTRDFQRWSSGSKKVGIEQDKLADILKDVNDRVGDFVETGGGPMADFFENIGPKVGVTAEHFKNLSGPQALQLYVSSMEKAGLSQQQMTFYMEAMASDATALLPLLLNNGIAMERYGDAAEKSGAVLSDSAIKGAGQFQDKLGELQQAVQAARNRLAEALIPIVLRFMDVLIDKVVPGVQSAITKIESLIQWFGQLPGPVQEAAAAIAAVIGTGGPILLAIGVLSKAFSALLLATGPIGAFIAVAAIAYQVWQEWGDEIKAAVGGAIDFISEKFRGVLDWLQKIIDKAIAVKDAIADALTFGNQPISNGTATPEELRDIGVNAGRGLVLGVGEGIEAGREELRGYLGSVTTTAEDEFETHSPSRVFQRIGNWLMQGLGNGIGEGAPGVQSAMTGVADAVNGEGESLSQSMGAFASSAQSAFQSVISGSMKVKDALAQLASQWLSSMGSDLLGQGFSGLLGAFGIGSNANGTSNWRGGLTAINERGGEIVDLPSGTRIIPHDVSNRMMSGAQQSVVRLDLSPDIEARILSQAEGQSIRISQQTAAAQDKALPARVQQINANPRRR